MELSNKQKQIVQAPESKVLVTSCAGSGKTSCLISRYQHLVDTGVDPSKIVIITFTNAAAEEISERLNYPQKVFIGTVHSYANRLLLSYNEDTTDLLEEEQFDQLFNEIKLKPQCVKPIEHLLLDEGQDSTEQQFEFIFDILQPRNWMVFADWRQSIYRWAGAYPDYIINLAHRADVTTYDLDENFRNAPEILDYARNIIAAAGYEYRDASYPVRGVKGYLNVDLEYSPYAIANTFANSITDYGNWFILARTNEQVDEMARALKRKGVPYDTFKRSQLSNKEVNARMHENTVKILTIHAAKGLEADNVIVIGAKFYNVEERCISYVAATRARNKLYWTKVPNRRRPTYGTNNWEN